MHQDTFYKLSIMNKLTLLLSALIAATGIHAATIEDMPSDAKTIAYHIKVGWNLGNTLEAYNNGAASTSETDWGNPKATQTMIDAVKDAGFNAIRIPVRWYPHFTYTNGVVTIDATWLARVKEVIGYCLKDNLYVIMNTHHELWLENHATYAEAEAVYAKEKALWTVLAKEFGEYDERVLFAGTNEVHIDGVWSECTAENATVQNKFNQNFIDVVRASGGKNQYRNLIVQTYACNDSWGISHLTIPTDPTQGRLMVEIHAYEPYSYAMNPDEPYKYWGASYKSYGTESWSQESYIDGVFNKLKTAFADKGYPVIMGECGAIRHSNPNTNINNSRAYYLKYFISAAKSHGVVPFLWDNGSTGTGKESYGLFYRKQNMTQVDNFSINAIMEGAKTSYPYTSGITTVINDKQDDHNIYNITGQLVKISTDGTTSMSDLPEGIYIKNGKKIAHLK